MSEITSVCRRIENEVDCNGRFAYLPHTLFQSTLFSATRERSENEYRKNHTVIVKKENEFGDTVTVKSPQTLFARPDMGVFLAVVGLVQKNGFEPLIGQVSGEHSGKLWSKIPITELYDLTKMGIGGRSSARERLLQSLVTLGATSVEVQYKNPDKHNGQRHFAMSQFWLSTVVPRKGRGGSTIEFIISPFLLPRKHFLFADAELCNSLKSDTARAIFWNLICREHFRGTVEDWRRIIGSQYKAVRNWKKDHFLPALDELSRHKYTIVERDGRYSVRRAK